ncbi:hypothetical protein, partial [Flavobacterium sp.]|uniref:hypothetical protein n=1 Tax=Flavobacterium sp. TaxID=239 RepID=UPI0038D4CE8A
MDTKITKFITESFNSVLISKIKKFAFFLLLAVFAQNTVYSQEGSKQFIQALNGNGEVANTRSCIILHNDADTDGTLHTYSSPAEGRMYFRFKAGEQAFVGMNIQSAGSAPGTVPQFQVRGPIGALEDPRTAATAPVVFGPVNVKGTVYNAPNNTGAGFIATPAQASAGASQVVGAAGYNGIQILPNTAAAGIYYIEFSNNVPSGNRTFLSLFDLTIRRTNGFPASGRLFSYRWSFYNHATAVGLGKGDLALFNYQAKDSIVTRVRMDNVVTGGFSVQFNETGPKSLALDTPEEARKSVLYGATRPSVPNNGVNGFFPIFFASPDPEFFPRATTAPVLKGSLNSYCNQNKFFRLRLNKGASVQIFLDFESGDGLYTANTKDVLLATQRANGGEMLVPWDGKNGLGTVVPNATPIPLKAFIALGEVHMPLGDFEQNSLGFDIQITEPPFAAVGNSTIYHDDSILGASPNNPVLTELVGCQGACHKWGDPTHTSTAAGFNYGDQRWLNTWWGSFKLIGDLEIINVGNCRPDAVNDTDLTQHPLFSSPSIDILTNDTIYGGAQATLANSSILLIDPSNNVRATTVVIPGQGTWSISPGTSIVTFTPEVGYTGDPTPLNYELTQTSTGGTDIATITFDYNNCLLTVTTTKVDNVCNGATNGAITINGGTSPNYVYSWTRTSPGGFTSSSKNLTGLAAGTYTYTITDTLVANACASPVATGTVIITQPTAITISSIVASAISCNGNNGGVTVTASGGTAPLAYNIEFSENIGGPFGATADKDGDSDGSYLALIKGFYRVIVTDANSCGPVVSTIVEVKGPISVTASTATSKSCGATNNGAITLGTVSGGTPPYIYSWTKFGDAGFTASTANLTGLSPGTYLYSIVGTAYTCAPETGSVVVGDFNPSATVSFANAGCGVSNGSITFTFSDNPNISTLEFSINGGVSYQTAVADTSGSVTYSGLAAGTYSTFVRSNSGCVVNLGSVVIVNNANLATPVAGTVTQPTCSNSNGSFTITNYNPAYTYTFSPSVGVNRTGANVTAPAGTYTVTSNLGACPSLASSNIVINAQPPTPATPTLGSVVKATCAGNGSFTITNYNAANTYTISPPTGVTRVAALVTAPAGFYTVTATLGSCSSGFSSSIEIDSATPEVTVTEIPCGGTTGTLTVTVVNGTDNYSFDNGVTYQVSNVRSGLVAGIYNVRIRTASLCVTPATPVQISAAVPVPTAGAIGTSQAICSGGNPAAFTNTTAGTGSGTITYRWERAISPFTTWVIISGVTSPTYDPAVGLTATTQYRRITISTVGATVCESVPTAFVTVTVNSLPAVPTIAVTAPTCASAATNILSTYSASLTYTSTPAGLSVGAGGVIT